MLKFNNAVHHKRYEHLLESLEQYFLFSDEFHCLYDPAANGVDETLAEFTDLLVRNSHTFMSTADHMIYVGSGFFVVQYGELDVEAVFTSS